MELDVLDHEVGKFTVGRVVKVNNLDLYCRAYYGHVLGFCSALPVPDIIVRLETGDEVKLAIADLLVI